MGIFYSVRIVLFILGLRFIGMTLPQCFIDKIEIDKKIEEAKKNSVFDLSLYIERNKIRRMCMFFIRGSTRDKIGPGSPMQMAIAA